MKRSLTYRTFFQDALSPDAGFSGTLLLRGALIAGLLAIIAGILGMHVITGNHATHVNHAAAVAVNQVHIQGVGANSEHAAHSLADTAFGISSSAGPCHDMQESGAACVPSANTSSLTVFPPHETGVSFDAGQHALSGHAAAYAFTPVSPTPCELSISRT